MASEPECKCNLFIGDHKEGCKWQAWKYGPTIHDLNISRLLVRPGSVYTVNVELAKNISIYGQLKPIIVKLVDGGYYEIIDGVKRYRAIMDLGWTSIRGIICE